MMVSLQLIWPSFHAICGNCVLQVHSFSCISQSQSGLFLLFQRQREPVLPNISRKKERYFGLYPSSSPTKTSPSLILRSSFLPFSKEKCHGFQHTAISSLPLHPGGQVHRDAQDLPDLLQDQKNLLDHALLGHPRKIPMGYQLTGRTATVREG